ncbi:MAG: aldo/keto reductase [Nannocystaceae bacterium]
MRRKPFGSTGVSLPVVGLGTWNMERDREPDAIAAIQLAIELGMDHIDTAELYGRGEVERRVGKAIAGRRDRVYLVSKVMPNNATRRGTVSACERSLARLGTDRLDLYLLHWPGSHPLEDTVAAFSQLVDDGKIRAWGVSNFDVDMLDALARVVSPQQVACNQVLYHLEQRAVEHRVLPWCRGHGIATVAYSPLGSGAFVSPRSPGGQVLAQLAARFDATPERVALAWLSREPDVFVIPKATALAHVRDDAAAAALELDADACALLDRTFPRGRATALPTL